jgi:hypothetical protein
MTIAEQGRMPSEATAGKAMAEQAEAGKAMAEQAEAEKAMALDNKVD